MAKDAATQSVALLGLLNGAVIIDGTAAEAYAVSKTASLRLPRIGRGDPDAPAMAAIGTFHEAVDLLADALGSIPFSDTVTYPAILRDASENEAVGWLACTPVGNNWPDAMSPVDPRTRIRTPANRCFPLYHYAAAIAVDIPDGTDLDGYCMEHPDALVYVPAGDGMAFFAGWCSDVGTTVRMAVQVQDFAKPWTVVKNADGSDYIAPATPMVLADQALNAWLPPEELAERNGRN